MATTILIAVCPSCGSDRIKKVRRDWSGEYRGQTYTVPSLEFHECPDCGERVYDRYAMRRIEAHSPAFAKARSKRGPA
jgi:YgiT-type zinc finger domain-containing protein